MTARRREVELTVERPFRPGDPSAGSVRLSARFETGPSDAGPDHSELARALDELQADLDGLLGPPLAAVAARPDRDLTELVETYRPRQRELVDLLLGEGELTQGEHGRLVEYLGAPPAPTEPPSAPPERRVETPMIAATPALAARPDEGGRPVPDLLRTFQIGSLKQAGAVRARREISFAEYMALKRHFQELEANPDRRAAAEGR